MIKKRFSAGFLEFDPYIRIFTMPILLYLFFIPFCIQAMYDVGQLQCAESSAHKKTNGFQGCINKQTCGQYGFYTQPFSDEGLCEKCEFKQLPERFAFCNYCRTPNKNLNIVLCMNCATNIEKFLVKSVKVNEDYKHINTLEIGAGSYLSKLNKSCSIDLLPSEILVEPTDKKFILSYDEAKQHIAYICKKYNIIHPKPQDDPKSKFDFKPSVGNGWYR